MVRLLLRSIDINDHVNSNLIINKSHLAPKDKFSTPRLAVTAVKIDIFS